MPVENILCVIPARGGSKGIPKKNLALVAGVPLVGYSIRSAIQADIPLSSIVVSSDSDEVLRYAKTWQVNTHKRPDEISGDNSSTEDAMLDVIKTSYPHSNFDSVLLLQPTSPIRLKGRINHAVNTYKSGDYDSLVSTTKFYPFLWKKVSDSLLGSSKYISTYYPRERPMRQNLTEFDYVNFENGNIYIVKTDFLLNNKCRIGDKVCVYPISEIEGLQIDDKFHLDIIEQIILGCNGVIFRKEYEL